MEEMIAEVRALREAVHQLQLLVMKDKVDTTWLDEKDAASALNLEPRTLRRYVKDSSNRLSIIKYRNTNGRKWQYSRKDIQRYKELTSNNPSRTVLAKTT